MATKVTLQLSWIFYLFFLCLLLGSGLAAGRIHSNFQHVLLPRAVDKETLDFSCWALPYGGIGFASRLLTYYTWIMTLNVCSPWTFQANEHWKFDMFVGLVSLPFTLTVTIITMVRCRKDWPFVLLAVWKSSLSFTVSITTAHAAWQVRHNKHQKILSKQYHDQRQEEQRSLRAEQDRQKGEEQRLMQQWRNEKAYHDEQDLRWREERGRLRQRLRTEEYQRQQRSKRALDERRRQMKWGEYIFDVASGWFDPAEPDPWKLEVSAELLAELLPPRPEPFRTAPPQPRHYKPLPNDEEISNQAWGMFPHKKRAYLWTWVFYYCLGLIVGLTGLMSLVRAHWSNNTVKGLTIGLFIFPLLGVLILIAVIFFSTWKDEDTVWFTFQDQMVIGPVVYVGTFMLLLSICMDWVLAVIAGNYSGKPDGDIAIMFWIYFMAKRLPMLQF